MEYLIIGLIGWFTLGFIGHIIMDAIHGYCTCPVGESCFGPIGLVIAIVVFIRGDY